MSSGYLGKISALVTVNTTDIASKVQSGFAAPFENALRSIETTLRNTNKSVEKSFNDIYTASQKQARAMAAAQMGAVKNFDADGFGKRLQIRDDIADPVKKLALEIEKTGGILRTNFEPRIVAIQAESQALFDRMARDASSVASGEITSLIGKVNELGASLAKASTMSAGWEKLSAIGRGDKGTRREDMMFAGLGSAVSLQSEERSRREAQAAQEAIQQQQRIQAVRDADLTAFHQRQEQVAASIHAEEQAAIAKERAAREAAEESVAAKRSALLAENEGMRSNLNQHRRTQANEGRFSNLPADRLEGAMTMLPANYYYNKKKEKEAKRAAQTGDISRMGADKFSLAIQQASYAVDDFFSVTGNFEQRLRAVGNNLSQLGFIIGSTFGLLAVVGVTSLTQAVLMVRKFTGATAEAEKKQAELKATVDSMNSSLERQQSLVQALADTYKGLTREIVESTAAPGNAEKQKASNAAADLREQQKTARGEMYAGTPMGVTSRAEIAYLEKSLTGENDSVRRFQLSTKLAKARERDTSNLSTVEAAARGVAASTPIAKINTGAAEMRERLGGLASMIEAIRNTPNYTKTIQESLPPLEASFRSISDQLAIFDMAIKIAGDDARSLGVEGFGVLRSRIASMQSDLASMEGSDASHLQGRLGAIGREMAAAMESAATPAEMQKRLAALGGRATDVLSDSSQFMRDEKAAEKVKQEAAREAERAAEVRKRSIERGVELVASPSQLRIAKFRKDFEDASLAAAGPNRNELLQQFVKNRLMEAAPAVAQMNAERAAAINPPYYSALQASDTSTAEGQKELNRLLRGEDAGKDKNLDELKTQSELLRDLIAIAKQNGIIVDL